MKTPLSTIPQLYRNVRRLTEILSVLSRYGLADWLSRIKLHFADQRLLTRDGDRIAELSPVARIRMALVELGPTFIKFGQLLSTRADLVGNPLADELAKLQSQVPPDPFDSIRRTMEDELKRPYAELFKHFDPQPLAAASIGQVHAATLPDGQEVVVKVRRTGIAAIVQTDLEILAGLAQLVERLDEFRPYQPTKVVRELSSAMRQELDFAHELQNLLRFRRLFRTDSSIRIPRPFPHLSTRYVLTMERLRGTKLDELNGNAAIDRMQIARNGARLYLKMIFQYGAFHADPHPGNLLVLPDHVIGLIDFGMTGRLSPRLRTDVQALLQAMVSDDLDQLTRVVRRIGNWPNALDEAALSNDLAEFTGRYSTQELAHFDTASALRDFLTLVRNHHIELPAAIAQLVRTLVTLDGTARRLEPDFSLMQVMKPFFRRLLLKRLSPVSQVRELARFLMQFESLAQSMPQRLETILEQIQTGKFDVHLDHRRLGPSVNRLVMGLMTSALFLGSSLMLSYKVPPLLFPGDGWWGIRDISLMGLTGGIVSLLLGARLIWAIRKSGNLDQFE